MKNIRALLFDKDGTLFDFYSSWGQATKEAALLVTDGDEDRAHFLMVESGYVEETKRFRPDSPIASGSNKEISDLWAGLLGQMDHRQSIYQRLEEHFRSWQLQGAVPVLDLAPFFSQLKQSGYRLGIATMDSEGTARAAMKKLEADSWLDFICGFDSGHGVKPGGGMVEAFGRTLSMDTSEIAVIGDSPHDMHMAKAGGGGLAIGVLTGVSSAEILTEAGAHHVLPSIKDLQGFFKGYGAG